MTPQTTISASTDWLEGYSLDQNKRVRVRFHTAPADTGILFVRSDIPGEPEVKCCPANLRNMPRWTSLEQGGIWVHHTEHLLATLSLGQIDNIRVEMEADRIPIMSDLGCSSFAAALFRAGRISQDVPRQVYILNKPVFHLDREETTGERMDAPELRGGRYIIGVPSDHLSVSYIFDWSHFKGVPIGVAEYDEAAEYGAHEVMSARSYWVEGEQLHQVLGPVQGDLLRLYPGCSPALSREAAQHKIADFVGDTRILGHPLKGRFAVFRTGHRIHHEFVNFLIRSRAVVLTNLG